MKNKRSPLYLVALILTLVFSQLITANAGVMIATTPFTGDKNNFIKYVILIAIAAVLVVGGLILTKKKK